MDFKRKDSMFRNVKAFLGMRFIVRMVVFALLFPAMGCRNTPVGRLPGSIRKFEVPSVAILAFENKADFPYHWKLGEGIRDFLVDELVSSRKFNVVTRSNLQSIKDEIKTQQTPDFRKEGRVNTGRLKNTEFLIKGSVTEFQYVSGGTIRMLKNRMGLGGSGQVALVTVTLYVIEVESGQILASETIDGRASTGSISFESQYRDIAFGGSAFYKTPLGKATKKVIGKCLKSISRAISQTLWEPRVIRIEDQQIYVSGGIDGGMKKNTHWLVFEKGEP
jgi:curli biogenesis system outer membrane secretion channel CsgG